MAGFGIIDHADTRDLIAAAARNPATRWCMTVLHPDGTAAAHRCGAGPRRWPPGQGPPGHGPPGAMTLRGLQAEGWHLEQPEPGVLLWRTPSGRSYATAPTQYAM